MSTSHEEPRTNVLDTLAIPSFEDPVVRSFRPIQKEDIQWNADEELDQTTVLGTATFDAEAVVEAALPACEISPSLVALGLELSEYHEASTLVTSRLRLGFEIGLSIESGQVEEAREIGLG